MDNLAQRLDAIIHKLQVTLEKSASLEKEHTVLKQRNAVLEKENITLKQQNKQTEEQINTIKLAKSLDLADEDREVLKKKLKHYIREIDKSLSRINV
jgi:transcriptional regulator NrdR family protein